MRKVIALVDIFWDGHHETYFKSITRLALELGCQVIAFCPDPKNLQDWISSQLQDYIQNISVFEIHRPTVKKAIYPKLPGARQLHGAVDVLEHWKDMARSIQFAASKLGKYPDLVFCLWIDSYLSSYLNCQTIDRIFPYKWSGLYFQPRHLRQKQRFSFMGRHLLQRHSLLHSAYCQSIALLDEGVAEALQASLGNKPVITFPDFADESPPDLSFELVQTIQEKAKGRKIIGLLGALGRYKGFLTMLRMSRETVEENFFFVFAGKLYRQEYSIDEQTEINCVIESNPDNCLFHLERIPGEPQFNAIISTCDALFALYDYPHSSNILTKAAIFEKPIITSNQFCIGERARRYQLGVTATPNHLSEALVALRTLGKWLNQECIIKPNFEEYRHIHSIAQLRQQLKVILECM
ncbi:MAG: glycosyltransferase family 1 protein [Tildeniella nuda ZEHNDER 1965/U140]|nr:glycosyltransferase family 1 protein [Tildeniella nuda ZEHNDER 1965/U140]